MKSGGSGSDSESQDYIQVKRISQFYTSEDRKLRSDANPVDIINGQV